MHTELYAKIWESSWVAKFFIHLSCIFVTEKIKRVSAKPK